MEYNDGVVVFQMYSQTDLKHSELMSLYKGDNEMDSIVKVRDAGSVAVRKNPKEKRTKPAQKRNGSKKTGHLIGRIVIIAIAGVFFLALILCILSYINIGDSYHSMGEEMLHVACLQLEDTTEFTYKGAWGTVDGVLYKGSTNMEDVFQTYINELKRLTGLEYTLIMGKTRAVTTIEGMKGKDISDKVYSTVNSGKDYADFKTEINGRPYYVYYTPLRENGQIIGSFFAGRPSEDIDSQMNQKLLIQIIITVVITVLFIVAGAILSKIYSRIMHEIAEDVRSLAGGDLTTEVKDSLLARRDELGVIAEGVHDLSEKLRDVIGKSKEATGRLNVSGNELSNSSSHANKASNQVTSAISEVSKGAVTQAESVQDAAFRTDTIGTDIDNISHNVSSLDEASRKMKESCDKTSDALNEIVEQNMSVAEAVGEIGATIKATNDSANSIAEFTDEINSIASKTNLLSLNASIEAARAGEAGRGFAVVADEIRLLADQSRNSSDEIKNIVDKLLEDAHASVQVLESLNESIRLQGEKINATKADMIEMADNVSVVTDNSQSIAGMVENLDTAKGSLVGIIQSLSAISEENAASTEETNASMQELNDTFSVISQSATELQDLAENLSDTISYFKN